MDQRELDTTGTGDGDGSEHFNERGTVAVWCDRRFVCGNAATSEQNDGVGGRNVVCADSVEVLRASW